MQKTLSIVVPCYFNEQNVFETYEVLKKDVLESFLAVDYELIFVDDGSEDQTLNRLKELKAIDPRIRIIKLSKNFGEFRAIVAGMSVASGDAVAVMSADLQDPPYLIKEMAEHWLSGEKVVIATRIDRNETWIKKTLANLYYWFLRKLVIDNYPRLGFDFFLIDRQVVDILVKMQEKNSTIYVQLIWTGFKPKLLEYVRREREHGKSMWTYWKRINLFIDTFIVFSYKPIRLITSLGLMMSVLGFISSIYFLYERIFLGVTENGWTSLIVAILVLSGVQLMMLGVIGEYIWRNLDETRKRPLFIIDEEL